MVLVDTSVWVRFLANQAPFAAAMDGLLGQGEVWGHDFVYGELLMGERGSRRQLLADYDLMHRAPVATHHEVVELVRGRRLHGRGIGWIDAHLLASALLGDLALWTADARLVSVAREIDVAYEA